MRPQTSSCRQFDLGRQDGMVFGESLDRLEDAGFEAGFQSVPPWSISGSG